MSSPHWTPTPTFRKPSRVFESRFQSFIALGDPSHGRARVGHLRAELEKRGLARVHRSARGRAPERIRARQRRAPEMADWVRRLGGDRGGAEGYGGPVRRRADTRSRSRLKPTRRCSNSVVSRRSRRPNGSRVSSSGTTSLDTTPGFTRPRPSRDMRPPVRRRAPSSSRSTTIRSTRSGRIARPDRWARSRRTSYDFAGESAPKKISRVRRALGSSQGLLISDPHNLAWLFNIRGSDVSYTPLPIGWAYLPTRGPSGRFSRRKEARACQPSQSHSPCRRARA